MQAGVEAQLRITAAVSVLFNEPKLLKCWVSTDVHQIFSGFSALQRAEIAEIVERNRLLIHAALFQCSSTSRNC